MNSTEKGLFFISTPLDVVLETNNILVHLLLETPITGKLEVLVEGETTKKEGTCTEGEHVTHCVEGQPRPLS